MTWRAGLEAVERELDKMMKRNQHEQNVFQAQRDSGESIVVKEQPAHRIRGKVARAFSNPTECEVGDKTLLRTVRVRIPLRSPFSPRSTKSVPR